jgi:regulator of protease activity HflC (stomatin/prohibitin superfamily)
LSQEREWRDKYDQARKQLEDELLRREAAEKELDRIRNDIY